MAEKELPTETPGSVLFPQFRSDLYEMTSSEIQGLSPEQMDFTSDQWEWSKWSIDRNLRHIAQGNFLWFLQIWGDQLLPYGYDTGDAGLATSPYSWRRLEGDEYWATEDIMDSLRMGLQLAQFLLGRETVGSLRNKQVTMDNNDWWRLAFKAHPGDIIPLAEDSSKVVITLEATFRLRYFEHITHLYNIQRLKRAQGLETVSQVPMEGYHALPEWDTSEPS